MRTAVISNINLDATVRLLSRQEDVLQNQGYGNELGRLINPHSDLGEYKPEMVFVVEDLLELLGHELDESKAQEAISSWFQTLKGALQPETIYYIADAYAYSLELSVMVDKFKAVRLEQLWQQDLQKLSNMPNVRIFPYGALVRKLGTDRAFSMKMWYMGKILHSMELQKKIAEEMLHCIAMEQRVPHKLLLLDLDNTLWGGLAGENDITPVKLSEDHEGMAYKNMQRIILEMQRQGVLLAVVSKNNEADALSIIDKHPHMALRKESFAALKINWHSKADNIQEIAKELNIGLEAMVFFDDNPSERQLIKEMLPQVAVPDFPDTPEKLPEAMVEIWHRYFNRPKLTEEDMAKTQQYAARQQREKLQQAAASFEEYLQGLDIELLHMEPRQYAERVCQLLNKTNQFNLTTRRHSMAEVENILSSGNQKLFAYGVRDRFGDNGLVAVVIVDMEEQVPVIREFVMSCRVMGKNIENAIIEDIENYLLDNGYNHVIGEYIPSSKNMPVEELYPGLGYRLIDVENAVGQDKGRRYVIDLNHRPKRTYRLKLI